MTAQTARRLGGGLLLLVLLVAVWAAASAALAGRELSRARALVAASADGLDPGALARAEKHARDAQALLRQPGPLLAQHVPVIGRSVRAARTVAESGVATIGSASSVAQVLDDQPLVKDGSLDLDVVRELHGRLNAAALAMGPPLQRLAELDPAVLPRPLARGVREAQDELLGADADAARAAALTGVLPELLGAERPRNVLVTLQNNAELRATGGLISTFTTGTASGGTLVLQPFRDVIEVADPPSEVKRVPADAEYVENYGSFLANTTLWKNANMSPDASTSNAVLAAVATRSLGHPIDVVLSLDVRAMADLTAALGSVRLADGTELTADELAKELYVTSYEGLEFTGAARRRELRAAADEALRRVLGGEAPPLALARQLSESVAGRHLTLWSAVPTEQAALVAAGAAGVIDADAADLSMVVAHNLGGPGHLQGGGPGEGNKLDYYVKRDIDVTAVVTSEDAVDVTQRVRLTNEAPSDLGPYAAGFTAPGRVTNLVSLYAGEEAVVSRLTLDGRPQDARVSQELGATVVRTVTRLDPGSSVLLELQYRVPLEGRSYSLKVVPQPLAQDAGVAVTVTAAPGVDLETRAHEQWSQGGARLEGQLDQVHELHVRVPAPRSGFAQWFRDFWTSPADF